MSTYTPEEDDNLVVYIAEHCADEEHRLDIELYERLVGNSIQPEFTRFQSSAWPWARNHRANLWLNRYQTRQAEFDERIEQYLKDQKPREPSVPPIAFLNPYENVLSKRALSEQSYTDEEPPWKKPRLASQASSPPAAGSSRSMPSSLSPEDDTSHNVIPTAFPPNHLRSRLFLPSSASSREPSEGLTTEPETATDPYVSPPPTSSQQHSPKLDAAIHPSSPTNPSPSPEKLEYSETTIARQDTDNTIDRRLEPPKQAPASQTSRPKKTPSVPEHELSEEDPFTSLPPSPKLIQTVVYDFPQPKSHPSFRGESERVRRRIVTETGVVPRKAERKHRIVEERQEEEEMDEEEMHDSKRIRKAQTAEALADKGVVTGPPQAYEGTKTDPSDVYQSAIDKAMDDIAESRNHKDLPRRRASWQHPGTTFSGQAGLTFSSHYPEIADYTEMDVEQDFRQEVDVFQSQEPVASTSAHDSYMLSGQHLLLPETYSVVHPSSPIVNKKESQHRGTRDSPRQPT
ncbi:hypothetical protein M422DRAFT_53212 [Sphaerobolus stellatus SS14]|uniref:Uncharacterized protein n=1 Tax=Sphaerobolus stellatus (strain SS14) TaxID=990650 RepID=A0A0C9V2U5_SPHS4|nr:hypothetical protein M422DRAFT_53212 [Sphaerobolus stellatus SS14]